MNARFPEESFGQWSRIQQESDKVPCGFLCSAQLCPGHPLLLEQPLTQFHRTHAVTTKPGLRPALQRPARPLQLRERQAHRAGLIPVSPATRQGIEGEIRLATPPPEAQ